MKKISLGFSGATDCMIALNAVIEPANKAGFKIMSLLDVFCKSYRSPQDFCARLQKIIKNNAGITEVWLNLSSSPYPTTPEGIEALKAAAPEKFKSMADHVDRRYPDEMAYTDEVNPLIAELKRLDLLKYVTWKLTNEINSAKYFWGTEEEADKFTYLMATLLVSTGRPVYRYGFTSSMITKPQITYNDWIEGMPASLLYDTSLFETNSAGKFDWNNNYFPTQKFAGRAISACGPYANIPAGSDRQKDFYNEQFMYKFYTNLFRFCYERDIDTVLLCTLISCKVQSNGESGYWIKKGPGYVKTPAWDILLKYWAVIKDGYELTATGLIGAGGKEVVVSGDSYTIK